MLKSVHLHTLLTHIGLSPDIVSTRLLLSGIAQHCAYVEPDNAFVALGGSVQHGNAYIQDAIARGAICVLTDTPVEQEYQIPIIVLSQLDNHLPQLLDLMYPDARQKNIIGITGTNGKTTVATFLSQSLTYLGHTTQIIGTLTGVRTTPDICTLYGLLQASDADYILLEVSSHALMQGRTRGLKFMVAIWTNLSVEHLDYHGSIEQYLAAKLRICQQANYGVFNADDRYYSAFAAQLEHDAYSLTNITITPKRFGFVCNMADIVFELNILGVHNIQNMLAVYTTLRHLGYSALKSVRALMEITTPEGRMHNVGSSVSDNYDIFVDYAHTPDALYQSMKTLQAHIAKEITLVFGCGGDRDGSKRYKMGRVADKYAQRIILTNDNPRSEDPKAIINDIVGGITREYEVILDRELAIQAALEDKQSHTIIIAGKGHEQFQVINTQSLPFNDSAMVAKYLRFH